MSKKKLDKNILNEHTLHILPSDHAELDAYIKRNKNIITDQIIRSIEYAVRGNLSIIEVFGFKNSDFVVTIPIEMFNQNLEHIYNQCLMSEQYEMCGRIKKIKTNLNKIPYKLATHEKT